MIRASFLLFVAAFFLPLRASILLAALYLVYMANFSSPRGINPFEEDERKPRR